MVVIRLARAGAHKKPFYQVVAADRRVACQGKCLERLGFFNPIAQGQAQRLSINQERLQYWLGVGAKPSERVQALLKELSRGRDTLHNPTESKKQVKMEEVAKTEDAADNASSAGAGSDPKTSTINNSQNSDTFTAADEAITEGLAASLVASTKDSDNVSESNEGTDADLNTRDGTDAAHE